MKTQNYKTSYLLSTAGNILMGLIFASTLSLFSISSAHADHDDYRGGNWGGRQGWRGEGDHDGWHGDRDDWRGGRGGYGYGNGFRGNWNGGYGGYPQGYPQPYGYAQPVYVPPPVYYPPQQSPGVSLFFPLNFRR